MNVVCSGRPHCCRLGGAAACTVTLSPTFCIASIRLVRRTAKDFHLETLDCRLYPLVSMNKRVRIPQSSFVTYPLMVVVFSSHISSKE
jgi:hypothetical protein